MKFEIYNTKIVFCLLLHKISDKNYDLYYPGIIGVYIYENISKKAWKLWIIKQTKIINEHSLNTRKYKDKNFLKIKMLIFLFN